MRLPCALLACLAIGCASRSRLSLGERLEPEDAGLPDTTSVEVSVDTAPAVDVFVETYSLEAGGDVCNARPSICLGGDDFGPSKAVRAVFEACTAEVGAACGDLLLVFDAEGCVVELQQIRDYSPAFVECVIRVAGRERWQCAMSGALRMLQQCGP